MQVRKKNQTMQARKEKHQNAENFQNCRQKENIVKNFEIFLSKIAQKELLGLTRFLLSNVNKTGMRSVSRTAQQLVMTLLKKNLIVQNRKN